MTRVSYYIGRLSDEEQARLNCSDGLSRSVQERIQLGFIVMRLPVIDDRPYRVFDSLAAYRAWADRALPTWLGYGTDAGVSE